MVEPTIDQPSWYYRLIYRNPGVNQLKKSILEFCGVKPVAVTYIGIIKTANDQKRTAWLQKINKLGQQFK